MNGDNQSQQELGDAIRAGFARTDAELARIHEQLMKIRTTDFRILFGISLTTALGIFGLILRIFGWLQ